MATAATIYICEDVIDRVIPPAVDRMLADLCAAGNICSRSVCGDGTRPRLMFADVEQRYTFLRAARGLTATSDLAQWLRSTNPRLAVRPSKGNSAFVRSIDYSLVATLN